jgi:hypothetical protein
MVGAAITPMVGGFLFRHYSPMSVWHFNMVCVTTQVMIEITDVPLALFYLGSQ